jgi:chromosome segregation ATPase
MLSRGEIEQPERLQAQLDETTKEQKRWHEKDRQADFEIAEITKEIADTQTKHAAEIQSLKEQLLNEQQRNEGIFGMAEKLLETVEGSKHCEKLTLTRTNLAESQLASCLSELDVNRDQVRCLSEQISTAMKEFQGLISCRQILSTACRSCKNKVKQQYRRQMLEGNFSETFSTFTRVSRSEMNRVTITEARTENCKCVLM